MAEASSTASMGAASTGSAQGPAGGPPPRTAASEPAGPAAETAAPVDAVGAPGGPTDGSNSEDDADEAGTRARKRWRAAQEAGRRFQRHAGALAQHAQNMPQSYAGLSIRIRHPEE